MKEDINKSKAEGKEKKGGGRGGRGRGRGRGKGRKAKDAEDGEIDAVIPGGGDEKADPENEEMDTKTPPKPTRRHSSKRPAATPERRVLFPDPPQDGEDVSMAKASPPVKQPAKKSKAKSKAVVPQMPSNPVDAKPTTSAEDAQQPVSQPKAKAKRKPAAKKKVEKKEMEDKEMSGKGEEENKKADKPVEEAGSADRKHRLLVGKKSQEKALAHMEEASQDHAEWHFVKRLFKSIDDKYKDKHDTPKFSYWSLSMYWKDHRVGLLQKQEGSWKHVLSFGGTYCPSIGMPVQACRMFVGNLVGLEKADLISKIFKGKINLHHILYKHLFMELILPFSPGFSQLYPCSSQFPLS